ncbi:phosphatidylglycerophosphatase A [Pseudomonas sp. Marseille-QA0892]
MIEILVLQAASGFGLGSMPLMPGTFGSLLGLPLAWWMLTRQRAGQMILIVLLLLIAVPLCHWASLWQGGGDAPRIVADEFLAFPVSVFALTWLSRPWLLLLAFPIFRLFDALKLPPLDALEGIGGGLGIVLDDLMAALYTWVVLVIGIGLWRRLRMM